MKNELPNYEILHELFSYIDGLIIPKPRDRKWFKTDFQHKVWHKRFCGKPAGKVNSAGHVQIQINGKHYMAHRIIWAMHHGDISIDIEIDHENEIKNDNRIENLRLATPFQNRCNTKQRANNTSGIKGVYWVESIRRWRGQVAANGERKTKSFVRLEDAAVWVSSKRIEKHGEFANHGNGCINGTSKTRTGST